MESLNNCPICRRPPKYTNLYMVQQEQHIKIQCSECGIEVNGCLEDTIRIWNHLKFIDYDDFIDDYSCFD